MAICQSPFGSSKALTTVCVASRLSPRTTINCRAVASLTATRATTVASEMAGADMNYLFHSIHRALFTAELAGYPQPTNNLSTRLSTSSLGDTPQPLRQPAQLGHVEWPQACGSFGPCLDDFGPYRGVRSQLYDQEYFPGGSDSEKPDFLAADRIACADAGGIARQRPIGGGFLPR